MIGSKGEELTLSIEKSILIYQQTGDEQIFYEIYKKVSENWATLIPKLAKKYYLDEHDVESVAHTKLYELVKSYDKLKGNFTHMLGQAIRRGCIDIIRQNKRREPETLIEDYSSLEFLASQRANAETECIEYIQKKHEQRQLLKTILKHADDKTRQSLIAFINSDFSYSTAAKQLGTTRKTIRRHITKLAEYFDGNYRDYFTVPTESTSKPQTKIA